MKDVSVQHMCSKEMAGTLSFHYVAPSMGLVNSGFSRSWETVKDVWSFQISFRSPHFIFRIIDIFNYFTIPFKFNVSGFNCSTLAETHSSADKFAVTGDVSAVHAAEALSTWEQYSQMMYGSLINIFKLGACQERRALLMAGSLQWMTSSCTRLLCNIVLL